MASHRLQRDQLCRALLDGGHVKLVQIGLVAAKKNSTRTPARAHDMVRLERDPNVDFVAYFAKAPKMTEKRRFIAEVGVLHLRRMRKDGEDGAVTFDIDATVIDGNECVAHGFEWMKLLYDEASLRYPVHVVTARPLCEHANVMEMLRRKGFSVAPDRLHMLPTHLYYADDPATHVEDFKWAAHKQIVAAHGQVLARFGDKLWDVAHRRSLDTYLKHVKDEDTYVFHDPRLGRHTLSAKLPGAK